MRKPLEFERPSRRAFAPSSDGRFIVYSAVKQISTPQDKPRLYLRRLNQLEAKPIAGTEGGISPILSPDDRRVGFWADGKLMNLSVDGGVPAALCDVPVPFGFSWGSDNQIVLAMGADTGLSRVSADGGKPETLTEPDKSKEELSHRLPHRLPTGEGILFTVMRHAFDPPASTRIVDWTYAQTEASGGTRWLSGDSFVQLRGDWRSPLRPGRSSPRTLPAWFRGPATEAVE